MDEAISGERGGASRLGWLKVLMLLLATVVVTHTVTYAVTGFPGDSGLVRSEAIEAVDVDRTAPAGFFLVTQVTPDGQLASAGVRAGDAIRFEHPWDVYRLRLPAQETYHLTILREGRSIPGSFVTAASRPHGWGPPDNLMSTFTGLFMAGAGVVIALRGRTGVSVLLGASLIAMSHIGSFTIGWENDLVRYFPVVALLSGVMTLGSAGILAFALLQRAGTGGRRVSRFWGALFWLYVAVATVDFLNFVYAIVAMTSPPLPQFQLISILLYWGAPFAAFGLLIRAAFETTGQERTRFGFLAVALGSYFGGTAVTGNIINLTGNDFSLSNPVAVLGQALAISGIVVFLYAALKHRVVDLGFAVNRTLVFGALSTALLFAFFFLEWGAEQVIPAHMREANLLASVGIALVLFLLFHKARDWVEKAVETLFFKSWRDNEARLDRFLKDAAYVSRADTLTDAALVALARYTGGAAVALYRVDEAGANRIDAAGDGLPDRLDADDPVLVRLRAEREPLDGDLPGAVGAALALPMVQRAEVRGLVLIGGKPSGEDYRPDERDILARVAQGVGMDLHALEIERLERRVETLDAQLSLALSPKRRVGARAGSMA